MQVYLNGSIISSEAATIPVNDRGFIFGDGVYEVVRSIDGRLFREESHLSRLKQGMDDLQISLPAGELDRLPQISRDLLRENSLNKGEATIYIQITRGSAAQRTHTFPRPAVHPTVYLSAAPFRPHTGLHEKGVDVITISDLRWARCNLKTVNLLPNVLARQQAFDAGVNSAVMIRDGMVTESPNANIFGVKDGTLYTFPESSYILRGITRQVIFEIADNMDIPVETVPVHENELPLIDELFFTGTTTDIQPVVEIDGNPVGEGRPGPVVRRIQEAYKKKLYGKR
ncbi:MAG: aminotransferase class IV [Balneolaceae bacterium]